MNVLETILNSQQGNIVQQLSQQFGLRDDQTTSALSSLIPVLAAGLQRNATSGDGLSTLMSVLGSGQHQQYVDNPQTLTSPETVADGNGILGHILGSREVSRQVANRASSQTGLSDDLLKRMLPVVAALVMGTLSKQATASPGQGAAGFGSGSGLLDMLTPALDQNRDGSVVDDVTGFLGRLMGGR